MELGGGNVKLGQKLPLKACEGEPKFDLLEHGGAYEAEGGVAAPLSISADWLTRRTGPHNHFVVVLFTEREVLLIALLEAKDVEVRVNR